VELELTHRESCKRIRAVEMAAAMLCNQAIQALNVDDYGVQRRAAACRSSNWRRRRVPGLPPRVETVSFFPNSALHSCCCRSCGKREARTDVSNVAFCE